MPYETLTLTVKDHVAHIRLNRPEALNTMILPFWRDMVAVFDAVDSDAAVRAAIISSTGRHFTAGLELSVMESFADCEGDAGRRGERLRRSVLDMQKSFSVIDRCRIPVIAAVQGACIGGGVDLISACDIRLCSADAYFRIQEINIGMAADVGTLQRLPHLMPAGLVRELAYTGRPLSAEEAHAVGLVNSVHDDAEVLLAAAMEMGADIAAKSPLAITGTKQMLNYARDHSIDDGLNHIATWQAAMIQTEDVARQIKANAAKTQAEFDDFLETRKPATKGT
ncbi:MAG: crotonase/enoyl-CoA hydratase family protein [Alphaproteobacteria bacterium]|jgi:enoyl-CoA hydratase|nr:crotonase/enoyl-CoA hydratase family protein [Alphaproteobacteria bacterium]MDP6237032.1 crotonase/enoyl-CoA hydratase family protein [Alphaproteobacteria bacterium]MDP7174155.1 crotonase/enoyl-CoA hydratase family protein [Alphaproteobacteria bacterium]MDP7234635.1 crotonase/enoyl-CoA hydratase family protein [Alphaproteobacteria bacterium]MDP7488331.1 crotonase/enoyl-CoA hydratase family protein [Alphaproteobacteria bacterium]|tara:strand:- start:1564 stop:2406 length:843 start_codon:yes stop_codon:yes gene_type:complete